MKLLPSIPCLGLLSLLFTSCGSSYTTTHIKDFRIYVETSDDEVRETVYELADEYNSDFGAEALTIVDEQEDANSYIRFISGLRARDNKLGLGQWITITSQEGRDLLPSNSSLQKTVMHTMEIDFDLENFRSKMDSRYEKASGQWRHLYHLFCHEVGHGFQMGHDASRDSVMYRSIPDNSRPQVDYDDYFRRARKFFNEQY